MRCAMRWQRAPLAPMRHPPVLATHWVSGSGLQAGLSWDDFGAIRDLAYEGRGG